MTDEGEASAVMAYAGRIWEAAREVLGRAAADGVKSVHVPMPWADLDREAQVLFANVASPGLRVVATAVAAFADKVRATQN